MTTWLLRCLKHHHWLLCLASCSTTTFLAYLLRWFVCIIVLWVVTDERLGGAGGTCVWATSVSLLWLSTPLLLIVEKGYFTLIFPGKLLEKLQSCREMLHKGVLDLIALTMLADLQQSFLQRWYRTWYLRLMLLLLHSMLLRVWSTCHRLWSLMWVRYCRKYAICTTYHHHGRWSGFVCLWLWLVLSGGLSGVDWIFSQVQIRLLTAWENIRTGAWSAARWRRRRTLYVFHAFLGRSKQI